MEQQQFKMRMSVSTKLLLIISFLLTTPIFFLNLSAVTLFRQDKKAYVFDSQATAAALTGREFVSFLDSAIGTLKLIVGSYDPNRPLSEQARSNISFYLDNQHSIIGAELYSLSTADSSARLLHRQFQQRALEAAGFKAEPKPIEIQSFAKRAKDLREKGYFFANLASSPEDPPLLAVVFSDMGGKGSTMPVGVGYVSLRHFFEGSTNSFNRFLIADRSGNLLFHSDPAILAQKISMSQDEIFQESWNSSFKAGAKEYRSAEGAETLGSFYKPGLDLVALSQIEYDKAMQATNTLTEKFVMLGMASLGIMIALGLIFSKRLIAPLNRLFNATAQVSSGNFDISLPVSSRDEIGALTNSFVAMSRKISDLIQEMVDKVRVDQELEIARTVQQSLFPPTMIQNEHVLLASHYQSASECGGDWWGYFNCGSKHILIIADATGHGLPSALMTASARSCFSVIEKLSIDSRFELDPAAMLSIANRVVYDSAQGKIMMTAFACVLDFETHTLTYSSAAHNPPWLFSKQEDDQWKMTSLVCQGERLGEHQENATFEVKQTSFAPGDILFLYTDGLIEGKNTSEEQYGKKQARVVIEGNLSQEPAALIDVLMQDFMVHNSGKQLDDDVTLAVARILS